MRKSLIWIALSYCFLVLAVAAGAQNKKAGLWMVASTTRIQQAGETPGNFNKGSDAAPSAAAAEGLPQCLTPELVDKFGVILPPSLRDCQVSNVQQTGNTYTADMTCKGSYNGRGSIESKWTDADHVVGKVRFMARSKDSKGSLSLAWTEDETAVFKSADCGTVKPRKIPAPSGPAQAPMSIR